MHISLPIGNGTMIMGSDTGAEWAPNFKAFVFFNLQSANL